MFYVIAKICDYVKQIFLCRKSDSQKLGDLAIVKRGYPVYKVVLTVLKSFDFYTICIALIGGPVEFETRAEDPDQDRTTQNNSFMGLITQKAREA